MCWKKKKNVKNNKKKKKKKKKKLAAHVAYCIFIFVVMIFVVSVSQFPSDNSKSNVPLALCSAYLV